MGLFESELHDTWGALRGQTAFRRSTLRTMRIRNLRGIEELEVQFPYPVTVLAGPNSCGKSTVLFACAAAYRDPDREPRELSPAALFPDLSSRDESGLSDSKYQTRLDYDYSHDGAKVMSWQRGRSWRQTFNGRNGATQPERSVYLQTLSNLSSPTVVRSLLHLGRRPFRTEVISDEDANFAERILPWRYEKLSLISGSGRDLLFAELQDRQNTRYSEFHMSAGERAIVRLSKDLSSLHDALVLIDEVETGLHPFTQQQLMLELQRLAVRQHLQIIVATHSPVIIDCVPEDARVFLDRDPGTRQVRQVHAIRDVVQKALFGQSRDCLSILCEDDVAEAIVRGTLDVVNAKLDLRHDDFVVGRASGISEFPGHVRTLGLLRKLPDFVFILDGDAKHVEDKLIQAADSVAANARYLFLPGDGAPELWVWQAIMDRVGTHAPLLGTSETDLAPEMARITQLLAGTVRRQPVGKVELSALARFLEMAPADIARIVARTEATVGGKHGMALFRGQLIELINVWRRGRKSSADLS